MTRTTFRFPVFKDLETEADLERFPYPLIPDDLDSERLPFLETSIERYHQRFPLFIFGGKVIDGKIRFHVMKEMGKRNAQIVDLGDYWIAGDGREVIDSIDHEIRHNSELTVLEIAELLNVRYGILSHFVGRPRSHKELASKCERFDVQSIYDFMDELGYKTKRVNIMLWVSKHLYPDVKDNVMFMSKLDDKLCALYAMAKIKNHEIQLKSFEFLSSVDCKKNELCKEVEKLQEELKTKGLVKLVTFVSKEKAALLSLEIVKIASMIGNVDGNPEDLVKGNPLIVR